MKELLDEDLLTQIIDNKDEKAFGILYDRYSFMVFNLCISMTADEDISKDLTQDTFIKVFLKLSDFNKKSRLGTWIYSIAMNLNIDYLRKNSKFITENIEYENLIETKEESESSLFKMDIEKLKLLLGEISTDEKMILLMKYKDEFTIKEISEIYNIGESAVKMRLKRAKNHLTDIYNKRYRNSIYY